LLILLITQINTLYFDLKEKERCYLDEYFNGNVYYT